MISWSIVFEGQTRTFGQLGISRAVRTLSDTGDQCELQMHGADATGSAFAPEGTWVEIMADDVVWFAGELKALQAQSQGSSEGVSITVLGPWSQLERIVYQQKRRFITDPSFVPAAPYPETVDGKIVELTDEQRAANAKAIADLSAYPSEVAYTPFVIANEDDEGAKITTDGMVTLALEYARAKGARLLIGDMFEGLQLPREEMRDVTCAQVLTRSLRFTPDVTWAFDYTTQPPTIHFVRRSDKAAHTFDVDTDAVTDVQLEPDTSTKVAGVTICWLKRSTRTGLEFYSQVRDSAGTPDGIDSMVVTLELQGGKLKAADGSILSGGEPAPEGIAERIYQAYAEPYYTGQIAFVGADCRVASYLLKAVNLTGHKSDYATMRACVKSQADDTATGRTTLQCGPPTRLGPSDLLELLRASSNLQPVTEEQSISRGGGGAVNDQVAAPPTPRFSTGNLEEGGEEHDLIGYITGSQRLFSYTGAAENHKYDGRGDPSPPADAVALPAAPFYEPITALPSLVEQPSLIIRVAPYFSVSQTSDIVAAGSYPSRYYAGVSASNASYVISMLDFSGLSATIYRKATIRGTITRSTNTGGSTTVPIEIEATNYIGTVWAYTPDQPSGAEYPWPGSLGPGFGRGGYAKSATVTFTKLVLYPVTYGV